MKILFHHRIASKDGQSVHMEELIAAFRRRGHEVIVAGPRFFDRQGFGKQSQGVGFLKSHLPRPVFEILELGYSLLAFWRLRKAYLRHRPDVLYERFNLFLLAGVWLRKWHGVPLFLEVNAPLYEERTEFSGLSLGGLAEWTQKEAWRGASMVLPVTCVLAEYVRAAGVPDRKITVVPNGIDKARFMKPIDERAAKARLGLEGKLVLGFTGFVRQWHGLSQAIEFLSENREDDNICLVIVGDGPGKAALVEQATRLGVQDKVKLLGLVERESIPEFVSAFDVALQPAATSYASPLKIFEYMALGRAMIAPRQPNIEEILTNGETALLFDPRDPTSFRDQLARLCADEALRKRLGDAARTLITQRDLTWDGNAERIEGLFAQAIAARRA